MLRLWDLEYRRILNVSYQLKLAMANFRKGGESNAVKEPTPFQSLVVQFAPAEVEHALRIRSYGLVLHRVLVCMDLY